MKVCFIGHRKIGDEINLKGKIEQVVADMIADGADAFLFGSRSVFNDLCLAVVSEARKQFLHLMRVYVRAEYPVISRAYEVYLLNSYEETYFSERLKHSGRSVYVERNQKMIDSSDVCVFYYDARYTLLPIKRDQAFPNTERKSGTAVAYEYAKRQSKRIINLFDDK